MRWSASSPERRLHSDCLGSPPPPQRESSLPSGTRPHQGDKRVHFEKASGPTRQTGAPIQVSSHAPCKKGDMSDQQRAEEEEEGATLAQLPSQIDRARREGGTILSQPPSHRPVAKKACALAQGPRIQILETQAHTQVHCPHLATCRPCGCSAHDPDEGCSPAATPTSPN